MGRNGAALTTADWDSRASRVLGALINAPGRGEAARLLLLFNAGADDTDFVLPDGRWQALLDSAESDGRARWQQGNASAFRLRARSVALLGAP
jgi:pullulanase/glycogen debranching enzyme